MRLVMVSVASSLEAARVTRVASALLTVAAAAVAVAVAAALAGDGAATVAATMLPALTAAVAMAVLAMAVLAVAVVVTLVTLDSLVLAEEEKDWAWKVLLCCWVVCCFCACWMKKVFSKSSYNSPHDNKKDSKRGYLQFSADCLVRFFWSDFIYV